MGPHGERTRPFIIRHWPSCALAAFLLLMIMKPYALERHFVYYPTREVVGTPAQIGLAYEDVFPVAEDGVKLHGWYIASPGAGVTLLLFHGNAGNIGHRLPWLELLRPLQANILIIDYRGYGRSEGQPFEEGLYRDARAAHSWWSQRYAGKADSLVLVGESLGGAVAVELATRVPVTALILQSTFTSAWDMAKTIMPIGLLQPLTGIRFDSAARILRITCPKLIIHGDRDDIVPFRLGKKLYDLAPAPKQFFEVPGAAHNDLLWVAGPGYTRQVHAFLSRFNVFAHSQATSGR
jgi:fermentation-respiration switch protein FrsA (DUF1100 family)